MSQQQASPEPIAVRAERAPSYDIWRHLQDDHWERIAVDVDAPNRREAITKIADTLPDEERYGTFATTRPEQFAIARRDKRVETVDVWE